MDLGILAQRNARALIRMTAAVETLAARQGIPVPSLKHGHIHDPQAAALYQRESIAEFLEALVAKSDPMGEISHQFQTAAQMLRGETPVADLLPVIAELDIDTLNQLEAAEQASKNRKGVLSAIAERRALLTKEEAA